MVRFSIYFLNQQCQQPILVFPQNKCLYPVIPSETEQNLPILFYKHFQKQSHDKQLFQKDIILLDDQNQSYHKPGNNVLYDFNNIQELYNQYPYFLIGNLLVSDLKVSFYIQDKNVKHDFHNILQFHMILDKAAQQTSMDSDPFALVSLLSKQFYFTVYFNQQIYYQLQYIDQVQQLNTFYSQIRIEVEIIYLLISHNNLFVVQQKKMLRKYQKLFLMLTTLLFISVSNQLKSQSKDIITKDKTLNDYLIFKTQTERANLQNFNDYPTIDQCKAYNLTLVIKKSTRQTPFNISTFGSWSGCGTDGKYFLMKTQLEDTACQQTISGQTFGSSGRIVTASCIIQGPFSETGVIRLKNNGLIRLDGASNIKACSGDVTFQIVDDNQLVE